MGLLTPWRRDAPSEAASDEAAAVAAQWEVVNEALVDLELAMEDKGWQRIGYESGESFTREGLRKSAGLCRVMAVANPLIKRGLNIRQAYVFGQGVEVQGRATGQEEKQQDVNAVVQAWWTDKGNRRAVLGEQARETLERALGTDGNVFITVFTKPVSGKVQVRTIPFDEVREILTNPEDRTEPRYYLRQWNETTIQGGRTDTAMRQAYYPALNYSPLRRDQRPPTINGHPVMWGSPVYHIKVNALDTWDFGIGDAYAAIQWARAYKEFLSDWAILVKSLSQFAWRATSKGGGKTNKLRQAVQRRAADQPAGNSSTVGATWVGPEDVTLEAMPKTGATIDSASGKPLAAMIAAGLDISVTTLLADPGTTGARAVAETLDFPMKLIMMQRQQVWAEAYRTLAQYAILQAVRAPQGQLRGLIIRDEYDREKVILDGDANGDDDTIEVNFPSLDNLPLETIMKAVSDANDTGVVPKLEILKLVLHAFQVKDADEILERMTDDEGNWVNPDEEAEVAAGRAARDAWRAGQDPATALRSGDTENAPNGT